MCNNMFENLSNDGKFVWYAFKIIFTHYHTYIYEICYCSILNYLLITTSNNHISSLYLTNKAGRVYRIREEYIASKDSESPFGIVLKLAIIHRSHSYLNPSSATRRTYPEIRAIYKPHPRNLASRSKP
jgi:hypothetical protein